MKIIAGFEFLHTKHCVTGSMLHVFHFNHCQISEEMLLGLGSGVGFIYWQQKGTLPFLGGRANVGRENEKCLEVTAALRCGVGAIRHTTGSRAKAEREMLHMLGQDQPVMIQVDMGLLPYFPFFNQYHFGYHVVAAAGYDNETGETTLADRDAKPYSVQLAQVMDARGSTFKPFPPQNAWMEYDFSGFHQPHKTDLLAAIRQCADGMVNPPIKNLGVRGIRTAGQRILTWPDEMSDQDVAAACGNVALYIRADAGTGGGLFRWMYARFLQEAAVLLNEKNLEATARDMLAAGDLWEKIADTVAPVKTRADLRNRASELDTLFKDCAGLEQSAWSRLLEIKN